MSNLKNENIDDAVAVAICRLFDSTGEGKAFYGHILTQIKRIYNEKRVQTAAVNITNTINLYINPEHFLGLTLQQRMATLEHEVLHLILDHTMRLDDFGDATRFNLAADMAVNSFIGKDKLGEGYIYCEEHNPPLKREQIVNYYYDNINTEEHKSGGCPKCQPNRFGKPGQGGQGQGGQSGDQQGKDGQGGQGGDQQGKDSEQDGEGGQGKDKGEKPFDKNGRCKHCGSYKSVGDHVMWRIGDSDKVSDEIKRALVNDAINRAAEGTKNIGSLPHAVQERIKAAKERAQVPWQSVLKTFVASCGQTVLSFTKKRKSKRFGTRPGIKLPHHLSVLVGTDVSGSINDKEHIMFVNEMRSIAKNGALIDWAQWDTEIYIQGKFNHRTEVVSRSGCGGTSPKAFFEYLTPNRHKYDAAIIFTDGYFYGEDVSNAIAGVPVLWIITSDGSTEEVKDQNFIKLPETAREGR